MSYPSVAPKSAHMTITKELEEQGGIHLKYTLLKQITYYLLDSDAAERVQYEMTLRRIFVLNSSLFVVFCGFWQFKYRRAFRSGTTGLVSSFLVIIVTLLRFSGRICNYK